MMSRLMCLNKAKLLGSGTRIASLGPKMKDTDAVLVNVWNIIELYLTIEDISKLARVSRRLRSVTVLGGSSCVESDTTPTTVSALSTPGFRSYHRFR
jgi:hypothetical protein